MKQLMKSFLMIGQPQSEQTRSALIVSLPQYAWEPGAMEAVIADSRPEVLAGVVDALLHNSAKLWRGFSVSEDASVLNPLAQIIPIGLIHREAQIPTFLELLKKHSDECWLYSIQYLRDLGVEGEIPWQEAEWYYIGLGELQGKHPFWRAAISEFRDTLPGRYEFDPESLPQPAYAA